METIETTDVVYYHNKDDYDIYLKKSEISWDDKIKQALSIDGLRLSQIKAEKQTRELVDIAIKQNILAYQYCLLSQDDKLAEKLIREKYYMIQYVKNQKDFLCMLAISEDPR